MSEYVVDNVVKKNWDKDKALYLKPPTKGRDRVFIFACQEYETEKGVVPVCFTCDSAFVWASNPNTSDEDIWTPKELIGWVKDNLKHGTEGFPNDYNEFIPIVNFGATQANDAMVEKYGLQDYVQDILDRIADVKPYSDEKVAKM